MYTSAYHMLYVVLPLSWGCSRVLVVKSHHVMWQFAFPSRGWAPHIFVSQREYTSIVKKKFGRSTAVYVCYMINSKAFGRRPHVSENRNVYSNSHFWTISGGQFKRTWLSLVPNSLEIDSSSLFSWDVVHVILTAQYGRQNLQWLQLLSWDVVCVILAA
jgi:hypothetical protein